MMSLTTYNVPEPRGRPIIKLTTTLGLAITGPAATQAFASPIALTGFNEDMIAENTAADPSAGVNAQIVGWDFYEAGAPDTSQGLPANGLLTSALGGTQFQFASYTADNAPVVTSGQSATLTLADLQKLANLDILDSSQNSRYTWSVRLNFANATSLTFSGNYDPDRTLSSDRVAAAEVGLIHDTATWSGSDPCSNPTHLYEWGSIGSLSGPHRDRVFAAAESKM